MTEEIRLNCHEVDFIVPAQCFNFRFSYTTKQGLSFIREFVLRLVQLAPMKTSQICSGQQIPDTDLSRFSASTGDRPSFV